jgi:signal transduction histidine kinase
VDAGVAWTRVRVVDEGPGFDPEQLSHSYGLRALRRRLEAVGGHIDAWSGAEGTRLTLCVPRPSR